MVEKTETDDHQYNQLLQKILNQGNFSAWRTTLIQDMTPQMVKVERERTEKILTRFPFIKQAISHSGFIKYEDQLHALSRELSGFFEDDLSGKPSLINPGNLGGVVLNNLELTANDHSPTDKGNLKVNLGKVPTEIWLEYLTKKVAELKSQGQSEFTFPKAV